MGLGWTPCGSSTAISLLFMFMDHGGVSLLPLLISGLFHFWTRRNQTASLRNACQRKGHDGGNISSILLIGTDEKSFLLLWEK